MKTEQQKQQKQQQENGAAENGQLVEAKNGKGFY